MGFGGPVGLDIPACLTVLDAFEIDKSIGAILLPWFESGLIAGLKKDE